MTYNEARKQNIGDMVQPKCKPGNVRITDICQAGKRILFTCDDHATYCHKKRESTHSAYPAAWKNHLSL